MGQSGSPSQQVVHDSGMVRSAYRTNWGNLSTVVDFRKTNKVSIIGNRKVGTSFNLKGTRNGTWLGLGNRGETFNDLFVKSAYLEKSLAC